MQQVIIEVTSNEGASTAAMHRRQVGHQREEDGSPLTVKEVVDHDVRVLDKLAPVKPEAGTATC